MSIRPARLFSSLILLVPLLVQAEITLAPIFADHAVLQRDKPLPVWGRANPKEKLTVTFQNQTVRTTVDSDGRWIVYFEPFKTSVEGADLVVAAEKETRVLKDVVVGEVWLASGQSNMERPVSRERDEEQHAAMVEFPLLRHLKIERTVAGSPAEMREQRSTAHRSEPGKIFEHALANFFRAKHRVVSVGEAMCLVAHALQ